MMYAKLALRNVKRSAKDYLIYVITLILSVGLFYGFMSIASPYYNESLPVKINLEILNKAMRIAVPIVALLVVFLISYVNTYMLRPLASRPPTLKRATSSPSPRRSRAL